MSPAFETKLVHQDILTLCHGGDILLTGVGSFLYCYSQCKLVDKKKIFCGQNIHKIKWINPNVWCVGGGKELATINWTGCKANIRSKVKCSDWLVQFEPLENDRVILLTSHNQAQLYNLCSGQVEATSAPIDRCILYSGTVHTKGDGTVLIFSGTVFSEVIVWQPQFQSLDSPPILYRIKGHQGVIFSINVSSNFNGKAVVCTTSDDRSVRVRYSDDLKSSCHVEHLPAMYGHTARVWKSLLFNDHFLTIGEDSLVCLWDGCGKLIHKTSLHQDAGIRAITVDKENHIYSGGSDGGISIISFSRCLNSPRNACLSRELVENSEIPRKVVFLVGGKKCYLTNDAVYIDSCNSGAIVKFDLNNKATDLVSSPCRYFVAVSLINGMVNIYDVIKCKLATKIMCNTEHIRCELLLWKDTFLLVQFAGTKVQIYDTSKIDMEGSPLHFSSYILPRIKERSCTCFLKHNDKNGTHTTLLGDRNGNLHVYRNEIETLEESLEHLHSHLGINDITYRREDDTVFTIGTGGWLRILTTLNGKLTLIRSLRVPMESAVQILQTPLGELVAGFHSTFLQLWSIKDRVIHGEIECGGGHRSFDFFVDDDRVGFIFIKNKNIYKTWMDLYPVLNIRNGFHSKMINCMETLGKDLLISGSDDNTVRLSRLEQEDVTCLQLLQQHISSVRAVDLHRSNQTAFIVTGGGREQLTITRIHLDSLQCHELVSHTPGNATAEGRYMCIKTVLNTNQQLFIIGGVSDASIRIFVFTDILQQIGTLQHSHCILRIEIVDHFLLSMGTDGKCLIWDLSHFLEGQVNDNMPQKPLCDFTLHQSGINSSHVIGKHGEILLATGGDDNRLSVAILRYSRCPPFEWKIVSRWTSDSTHACQITGVMMIDNWLVSVSTDQRVALNKLKISSKSITAEFISDTVITVSDPHGFTLLSSDVDNITISVYGKGIEVLKINLK